MFKISEETQPTDPKDNLEYDLRSSSEICTKVRNSEQYAQNLYAALCNNEFVKREMWPILKDQHWNCSWRYAGGIIAHIRQTGDYIDWYCSGIISQDTGFGLTGQVGNGYVSESTVTEEIRNDLYQLGWLVVDINKQGE